MKIQDLKPAKGVRRPNRRKGRGIGSGRGKTGGRGHKGQKSRTGGGKQTAGSEGGQMPLIRRIPKRGFASREKKEYSIVNLEKLNSFREGTQVTPSALKEKGLIKPRSRLIKILGKGELKKNLTVSAHAFSKSARSTIEKAGGKTEIIKC